jgi:hypothetical protein
MVPHFHRYARARTRAIRLKWRTLHNPTLIPGQAVFGPSRQRGGRVASCSSPTAAPFVPASREPGGERGNIGLRLSMTRRLGSDERNSAAAQRRNAPGATSADVAEQLRQLDCDPIAGMARLAQDVTAPIPLRARMFAELATYVAPRRKAMELSGPNGGPIDLENALDYSLLSVSELETLAALLDKAMGGAGE